ncbi:MAG: MFS transporter [Ancrocorticia sp.]
MAESDPDGRQNNRPRARRSLRPAPIPHDEGSATRGRLCVATVLCGAVVSTLMQNFLTVNLPGASAELDATAWYGWVPGLYLAASTVFIPPWALISDRRGPRRVFLLGLVIWILGTVALSLSTTTAPFLASRVLQGVGAAAIVPAGFAAISVLYRDRYGRLIGMIGAVQATVVLGGAPLGGWLGAVIGWRASLQMVAVIALVPVILGWLSMPTGKIGRTAGAERGLQEAVGEGNEYRSNERSRVKLFSLPLVRRAAIQTMLLASIAFGVSTYLPLLLHAQFSLDTAAAAALTTPALLGVGIGSAIGGMSADKKDTTRIAWLVVVVGLAIVMLPLLVVQVPALVVQVPGPFAAMSPLAASLGSAVAAAGVGIGLPSQLVNVERATAAAKTASSAGIIQGSRNIGGALGVALFGIPLQLHVAATVGSQLAFVFMLVVAIVSWVLSRLGGANISLR